MRGVGPPFALAQVNLADFPCFGEDYKCESSLCETTKRKRVLELPPVRTANGEASGLWSSNGDRPLSPSIVLITLPVSEWLIIRGDDSSRLGTRWDGICPFNNPRLR